MTGELANAPAKLERQLTEGDFDVGEVVRVDLQGKLVITPPTRAIRWNGSYGRSALTASASS